MIVSSFPITMAIIKGKHEVRSNFTTGEFLSINNKSQSSQFKQKNIYQNLLSNSQNLQESQIINAGGSITGNKTQFRLTGCSRGGKSDQVLPQGTKHTWTLPLPPLKLMPLQQTSPTLQPPTPPSAPSSPTTDAAASMAASSLCLFQNPSLFSRQVTGLLPICKKGWKTKLWL